MRLGPWSLVSSRLEEMARFYTEVVGLPVAHEQPGHHVWFSLGGIELAVHAPEPEPGPDFTPSERGILMWFESERPLAEVGAQLRERAAPVWGPFEGGPRELLYTLDPDGNMVGLFRGRTLEMPARSTKRIRSRQLTDEEMSSLLRSDVPARLATLDPHGYPRVVPIWFIWADGAFHMTSLDGRVHVDDIRRDPRAAICIDLEDRETRRNAQIRGRGLAELFPDHQAWTRRITLKYVPGPDALREAQRRASMGRVHIRLRAERLISIGTPAALQR